MKKPKLASGFAQKEVDRLDSEFQAKSEQMSKLTQDDMAQAPVKAMEPQTQMSKKQILSADAPMITPTQSYPSKKKKNPAQDALRREGWEYIRCVCENNEIKGEQLEFWLKPAWDGEDCNFWVIPVNRPVMIPRHVALHIRSRKYHRLMMDEKITIENTGFGEMKGQMVATHTMQRLNCHAEGF